MPEMKVSKQCDKATRSEGKKMNKTKNEKRKEMKRKYGNKNAIS
jgi:hypothetical protein